MTNVPWSCRAQELCEMTFLRHVEFRSCVKVEVESWAPHVPNSPYSLCGRTATLNEWLLRESSGTV